MKSLVLAALVSTAMVGVASAKEVSFDRFDRDNNGAISKQEFVSNLQSPEPEFIEIKIFNKADLENDGLLTESELQRALRLHDRRIILDGRR